MVGAQVYYWPKNWIIDIVVNKERIMTTMMIAIKTALRGLLCTRHCLNYSLYLMSHVVLTTTLRSTIIISVLQMKNWGTGLKFDKEFLLDLMKINAKMKISLTTFLRKRSWRITPLILPLPLWPSCCCPNIPGSHLPQGFCFCCSFCLEWPPPIHLPMWLAPCFPSVSPQMFHIIDMFPGHFVENSIPSLCFSLSSLPCFKCHIAFTLLLAWYSYVFICVFFYFPMLVSEW